MGGTFTAGALTATGAVTGATVTSTGKMHAGSTGVDYPANGGDWNFTLTLNGADSTSIGFHDSGANVGKIRFQNNNFYIGENAGWGTASVSVPGALSAGSISTPSISATTGNIGGVTLASNGGSFSGTLTGGTFVGNFSGDGIGFVCTQSSMGPGTRGIDFELSQSDPDGSLDNSSNAWNYVGNMTKTITLARRALVSVHAAGSQSGGSGHVGYRFVVDGAAKGNPTWGQLIKGPQSNHWHNFSVEHGQILAAGSHTIGLQARADAVGAGVCYGGNGDGGEYTSCRMIINVTYCDTSKCPDGSYY
jgi:hypothetical protein